MDPTPNDDQKAWNIQSLDIASVYITTPLSQTLGKQRVYIPRKQRVSAKVRKNMDNLSTHAECTSFHMAEIHRILDIVTRGPISAPIKYYVKQLDFRRERLYHMTRGLALDSDTQMEICHQLYSTNGFKQYLHKDTSGIATSSFNM